MLVLTRKLEEQIRIGDDITISILRVKGNTVRVGIDAPRTIRVVRGELPDHGQGELAIHTQGETPTPPTGGQGPGPGPGPGLEVAENAAPDEEPMPSAREPSVPATTAVRQFMANRARRQNGKPPARRSDTKPAAATLVRSA